MIFVPLPEPGVSWRRIPWLWALMGANAVVLAVSLLAPDPESFILAGALDPEDVHPLSLVSSMFLHASIGHLVGNLLFLWGVGQPIHHRLGGATFLAAYAATGLAAGFAYLLSGSGRPAVGASGAISGLMGLFAALWPRRRMRIAYWIGKGGLLRPRAAWALGVWVLLQVWFAGGDDGAATVAYSAHLGGFAAGAAIGLLLRIRVPAGPGRDWMLETPEPGQEIHAGHLARAVAHNLLLGASEPMTRAWDEWESGPAHIGLSSAELGRVQGDFERRGDGARASKAVAWRRRMFGR